MLGVLEPALTVKQCLLVENLSLISLKQSLTELERLLWKE